MGMEVSGKLHEIFETKQITERFQKREFVVEMGDKYPQHVLFQLTGDRVDNIDQFKVGDMVKVEFSLRGRQWTSPKGEVKYFNSLDAWTVEGEGGARDDYSPPPAMEPPPDFGTGDDDIPF